MRNVLMILACLACLLFAGAAFAQDAPATQAAEEAGEAEEAVEEAGEEEEAAEEEAGGGCTVAGEGSGLTLLGALVLGFVVARRRLA